MNLEEVGEERTTNHSSMFASEETEIGRSQATVESQTVRTLKVSEEGSAKNSSGLLCSGLCISHEERISQLVGCDPEVLFFFFEEFLAFILKDKQSNNTFK